MQEEGVYVVSSNAGRTIVQLSGRHLPSVCIQGDTLANMARAANENARIWLAKRSGEDFPDDMLDMVIYLNNTLVSMVMDYNAASDRVGHDKMRPLKDEGLQLLTIDDEKA